ncbi:MAG: hypothetical protein CL582_23465 [Alteromonadaceae bacterium]|nr:hypothetical protein [Alteromonadaceae bacterium]|tara:strand:- start:507 stop:1139 length:633 start_codon:yes stop_codon:yes gene_type:complete
MGKVARKLEKLAVSLKVLRAAHKRALAPKLVRRDPYGFGPFAVGGPSKRIFAKGDTGRTIDSVAKEQLFPGGALTKSLKRATPEGREFFNRTILSHEGSELGKHFGKSRFASHISTRPLLHDMNIAATATGPGAKEIRESIKRMRHEELEGLKAAIPGLGRLRLGEKKLNRSGQRALQKAYERAQGRSLRAQGISETNPALVALRKAGLV